MMDDVLRSPRDWGFAAARPGELLYVHIVGKVKEDGSRENHLLMTPTTREIGKAFREENLDVHQQTVLFELLRNRDRMVYTVLIDLETFLKKWREQ